MLKYVFEKKHVNTEHLKTLILKTVKSCIAYKTKRLIAK